MIAALFLASFRDKLLLECPQKHAIAGFKDRRRTFGNRRGVDEKIASFFAGDHSSGRGAECRQLVDWLGLTIRVPKFSERNQLRYGDSRICERILDLKASMSLQPKLKAVLLERQEANMRQKIPQSY